MQRFDKKVLEAPLSEFATFLLPFNSAYMINIKVDI